ncbi:MAG: PSD1 and planctomycete cytochrome C domain-containing protein [Verrucomicrobiales bacterium]|nr:PSD1 and planctomycete cytochrome C domain-containing protein [Verrucomicrobiales bacterium]
MATVSSRPVLSSDYERDIKPVLKERCYSCHGALKQKSDLRVDTASAMLSAKIIVPKKPTESELFLRISHEDESERMPPEGHALTPSQIEEIRSWIDSGAPAPANEIGEDDPKNHWSFQPVEKPPVPLVDHTNHPVDSFFIARQREEGIVPQGPAARSILLRRLYLDLIGLPPTEEQLRDDRPYEVIVDELLASLHHGERWGRHWMDVWRYSDWYGLGAQLRYSQKHIWHWRDWIVESLNADKGYDQMIREMLAGDEIAPEDPDVLRATGFLARNYFLFNRTTWLDNTIEHTGKAFLGLTLNCAKCHDHKYDPISMVDYYRFRALFEPHQVRLDPVPGVVDFEKAGLPRVFDDQPEAETFLHLRGDPKQPDKETEITPGVPVFLSGFAKEIAPVSLSPFAYAPGARNYVQEDQRKAAREKVKAAEASLATARGKKVEEPPGQAFPNLSGFEFEDDFSQLNSDRWELSGDGLVFRDGALHQESSTRTPAQLILRKPLPENFEVTCRYTTTGGSTYRSVSFRIDRSGDGKQDNLIYTSEHAPGPKLQAAYTRNGKTTYASDGRVKKPQATGEEQELRIAVRGPLVNVWRNGVFSLAYRFPDRLPGGRFSLSAFDATAIFHQIRFTSLSPEVSLTEAKNKVVEPGVIGLGNEREMAEAELKAARAELSAVEAIVQADRIQFEAGKPVPESLAKKAASLQAEARSARAEAELLRHKDGDAKKRKAAAELKKKADEQLTAVAKGVFEYESLRGSRKALETPAHKESEYAPVYPGQSTGRRRMLADWIASEKNPLTARVTVNHVWMRHFGEPLVPTVFDFGRQAKEPVHIDLLNYLAAEFMESGWSFRHLHRLLVTSQTYQRSSSNAEADRNTRDKDPNNEFYWRMNPGRMESQVVRDSLLSLSGRLDRKMGGPTVDANSETNRRSIYLTHSPDKLDPFLTTFDDADLLQCYRRGESIVPQQALALSNSRLAMESAAKIAAGIPAGVPGEKFVSRVFVRILARNPESAESGECLKFLRDFVRLDQGDEKAEIRARAQLAHALLNHNDFLTIR